MDRLFVASTLALALLGTSGAAAQTDRDEVESVAMPSSPLAEGLPIESMVVEIRVGDRKLWSGTLRLGPKYGNASFSQSRNEAAEPCPSDKSAMGKTTFSNQSLNFNISRRRSWQQEPDKFNVNVNWAQPIPACEGEGTNTLGMYRVVNIPRGSTVSATGGGGVMVRLTRQR